MVDNESIHDQGDDVCDQRLVPSQLNYPLAVSCNYTCLEMHRKLVSLRIELVAMDACNPELWVMSVQVVISEFIRMVEHTLELME